MRKATLMAASVLAACLLVSGRLLTQEKEYSWSVHDVSDGDHMVLGIKTILADSTPSLMVRNARLVGILCPYPGQPFSKEGREFTENAVRTTFKEAQLKVVKEASPKWVVDFVLPDGGTLSRELLRNGLAWAQPPDLSFPQERAYGGDFKALEDQARKERRGLWADSDPVPPWKFVAQLPAGSTPPAKVNPSYDEARAAKPASALATDPDVITKVVALMRQKGARMAELVQQRDSGGGQGTFEMKRQELDRWADSELERLVTEGARQEGDVIARNMTPAGPSSASGPQLASMMSDDASPFVKEKVGDLMKREGEAIKQLVADLQNGGSLRDFEAKMRQLDQQEDSEVQKILQADFLRKQQIVMRTVDSMPMSDFVTFWDWDTCDYRQVRRDVSENGRWIGRIVQDRNGNVVWYDSPNGSPHWIKYNYLSK